MPAVIVDGWLLGWWDGAAWQRAYAGEDLVRPPAPVEAGTDYQFVAADGSIDGGPAGEVHDGCRGQGFNWFVDDPRASGRIGLPVGYDILPRLPSEIAAAPAHAQSVEDWLAERGVADPEVSIDRVTRVDLDGNGRFEVIIEASRLANPSLLGEDEGDYSVVLLRVVGDDDQVQTRVVAGAVVTKESAEADSFAGAIATSRLFGLADLDQDGEIEIVIAGAHYEGASVSLVDVSSGQPETVLRTGCGA